MSPTESLSLLDPMILSAGRNRACNDDLERTPNALGVRFCCGTTVTLYQIPKVPAVLREARAPAAVSTAEASIPD